MVWSSKNVPIEKGYEPVGELGIICSDMSLDVLYSNAKTIHQLYQEAWKKTNPELKNLPEAYAVYSFLSEEANHPNIFLDQRHPAKKSYLEVTLVKGIKKI